MIEQKMALTVKRIRKIFLLVITTFLFFTLNSFMEIPIVHNIRLSATNTFFGFGGNYQSIPKAFNNVSTIDLTEIVNQLHEHNWTCYQNYANYRSGSDNQTLHKNNSASIMLYQPPCPLGALSDFHFLINKNVCGNNDVYMLIVMGSHPKNQERRNVYRQTLGSPGIEGLPFKLVFQFGYLNNVAEQRSLEEESNKYGDIIQGSFIDAYHNVTLRDLMGLRWAWQYCPQVRFIMRMDDDVLVDIYNLVDAIEQQYNKLKTTVGCFQMLVGTPVFRSGHYGVTKEDHPDDIYDPYCQGWMYILTPQVAYNLDVASLRVKPYWMNDAYITGTLIKALGTSPIDIHVPYTINYNDLRSSKDSWPPVYTVGPTGADINLTLTLHRLYHKNAQSQKLPKFKWTKTPELTSTNETFKWTTEASSLTADQVKKSYILNKKH